MRAIAEVGIFTGEPKGELIELRAAAFHCSGVMLEGCGQGRVGARNPHFFGKESRPRVGRVPHAEIQVLRQERHAPEGCLALFPGVFEALRQATRIR